MKKKNITLNLDIEELVRNVKHTNVIVFFAAVLLSLSVAVFLLYRVVLAGGVSADIGGTDTGFDEATLKKIEQLRTSDEPSSPLDFSSGRVNPFTE